MLLWRNEEWWCKQKSHRLAKRHRRGGQQITHLMKPIVRLLLKISGADEICWKKLLQRDTWRSLEDEFAELPDAAS
eukprot:7910084-Karenia_brevis.AAC.1